MSNLTTIPAFFQRSFEIKGCKYKVILTEELNPITCKPTGVYLGTFISFIRGTKNFKFHKDKIEKQSNLDLGYPGVTAQLYKIIKKISSSKIISESEEIIADDFEFPERFELTSFDYLGVSYNVAITPELLGGLEGLERTGIYLVTMVSNTEGTKQFELIPDAHFRWIPGDNMKGMDPGLIDELDQFIKLFVG